MKHLAKQENRIRVNYLSILSKVNNVNSFLFFFLAGVGMGERQRNDNCTKSADLMEREKKKFCALRRMSKCIVGSFRTVILTAAARIHPFYLHKKRACVDIFFLLF